MFREDTVFFTDPHVHVDEDIERFTAMGRYIVDHRPTYVVCGGDFMSFEALSHWDSNKRLKMEGRRFREELISGRAAMDALMAPIVALQEHQRTVSKKKLYRPDLIFIEGNHENWYPQYVEKNPELEGVIDLKEELGLNKYLWEWVPFKEYHYINGVGFTHVAMNGIGKPLSGARMHINTGIDHSESLVYGHTHLLSVSSIARKGQHGDIQTFQINGGVFSNGTFDYAIGSKGPRNWWQGFLHIEHLDEQGKFDFRTVRLDRLLEEYL